VKSYLVLDLTIHDLSKFRDYIARIPEFIERYAGRYIVRGAEAEVVEGDWRPERLVIIEFPSRDHAERFLQDPEAQALFAIRHDSTSSRLVLVEGGT